MFASNSFIWLLLPLGIALGWVLARRLSNGAQAEPPEEAVAGQRDASRAPPLSYEEHLILGSAYRQRGELDRAIAIHEQLVATAVRGVQNGVASRADAARIELSEDYVKAGLMDRAEEILSGLVARGAMLDAALEMLVSIYEQSRDWKRAAVSAERLQSVKGTDMRARLAHYRCEIAEQCVAAGDLQAAEEQARHALGTCPESVRASLLLGDLAEKRGDAAAALKAWQRVPRQDARFIAEVLPRLKRACQALNAPEQFVEFMDEADHDFDGVASVTLEQARLIHERGGDVADYLARRLAGRMHWAGLLAWLDAQCEQHPDEAGFARLRDALRERLKTEPGYRCTSCGLTPGMLFWQCPSCKHWGTMVPAGDAR